MEMDICPEGWVMKVNVTVTVASDTHWTLAEQLLGSTLLKSQGNTARTFYWISFSREAEGWVIDGTGPGTLRY